jgi:hypothetical protein
MLIKIQDTYESIGRIGITLSHDTNEPNSKQGLKTILRLTGDASTYIKALSGINEDGGTYIDLELQGIEAIGLIEALHAVTGKLLKAVD